MARGSVEWVDLDLRLVRAFVAVADERHFGRAARLLHSAQPAVSRQVRRLESQLGVRLLDRTSRSVELTEPGRTFLADARDLLASADAALRRVRPERGLTVGFLAAIFPTDRIDGAADLQSLTTVGTVHVVASLVSLVGGTAGMFVLSRTFKRDPRWRAFWPVSLALAFAALILLFLQDQGPRVGLNQRLLSGTIALWLVLVAFRLHSVTRRDGSF